MRTRRRVRERDRVVRVVLVRNTVGGRFSIFADSTQRFADDDLLGRR